MQIVLLTYALQVILRHPRLESLLDPCIDDSNTIPLHFQQLDQIVARIVGISQNKVRIRNTSGYDIAQVIAKSRIGAFWDSKE
jgi:hypothetical protein